jgi:probable F420-dependent oxidoreductase
MPLGDVPAHAQRAERLGFDGLLVPEAVTDAVLASLLALEHTTRLQVLTGVVVAFARSPMLLAQDAWALQRFSGGRFGLGLGSQIRANVEQRYGMPWSAPADRMRDYAGALRAVFDAWQDGTRLDYRSESYTLTRMQPFFDPGPLEHAKPPIWLGAVGPRMTRVAGEMAEGVIAHPTNSTPDYLRGVTRPELEAGRADAQRSDRARVIANPLTAAGATPAAVAEEREAARRILAFTYSTPAYAPTLRHHGWDDVGPALRERARAGDWAGMNARVDEAMLDVLVPSGLYGEIADILRERYAGVADGIALRMPANPALDDTFAGVVAGIRD